MSKSRQPREAAKALRLFVNPLSIWTDAVLKGGKMVLDSMHAAAKHAGSTRVGVIPTADAPLARRRRAKSNAPAAAKRKPKARRR